MAEPRLLDIAGAARYCSVSTWTMRQWVAAGHLRVVELPAVPAKPGARQLASYSRVRIDRSDLDQWLDERRAQSQKGPQWRFSTSAAEPGG